MNTSAAPSLSAYAQWKLEEEARFYATFPQARCTPYLPATPLYPDPSRSLWHKPDSCQTTEDHTLANIMQIALPLSKESVLTSALDYDHPPTSTSDTQQHLASPTYHDAFQTSRDAQPSTYAAEPHLRSHPSSAEIVQPHAVVPSQPLHTHPYDVPIMDHLPLPDSAGSEHSSSLHQPPTPHTAYFTHSITTSIPPDSYSKSPNDQWDHSLQAQSPISPHHLTENSDPHDIIRHHPTRTITPTSNPYPRPSSSASLSSRRLSLTELPAGAKKSVLRKPPLACHFCRGRKIACGAPDPSNPNRTCNQCERRSLKCEYPLESRRGMRKKKTPPLLSTSSAAGGATSSDSAEDASGAKTSPHSPKKLGRRPKASPS